MRGDLKHHQIQVQIPPDLPLLSVDGLLLEQVLVNLLENAARYTPAGTRVEITAKCEANRLILRIADTGPGLPAGAETRVFEKFFRATTGSPDGQRGVGLGLAICEGIIKAHKGQITAANRPDGGAEFTISLPLDQNAPRVVLGEVAHPTGA